jgi:4-amino-4-deoxy-L-arabinose transferase-like glycosyltransferase
LLFKSSLRGITKTIQENKSLSLIILFGFLVRIWGVWYGLPLFFVGDEHHLPGAALKMGAEKSLLANYSTLYEPPFLAYLYLVLYGITFPFLMLGKGIFSISELQGYLILNPTFPWLVARLSTVIMGTILIYLIYRITSFLGNRQAAILAALFVAFDPMIVQMSHFARIWVPGAFLAYFSLYFSIQVYKRGRWQDYILSAVFAGFSAGTTWITGMAILALIIVFFVSDNSTRSWRLFSLAIFIFILIVTVTILINPYNFLRYLGMHLYGQVNYSQISNWTETDIHRRFNLLPLLYGVKRWMTVISEYNLPILLGGIVGSSILLVRDWRLTLIIFCFPTFHFAYIVFSGGLSRYMIPVMPALEIAAAWFAVSAINLIREKTKPARARIFSVALVILLISYSFLIVMLWDYRISYADTRTLAREWIEKHIPSQSRIVMSERNRVNYFYLWENPEAVALINQIDSERMGVERKYLYHLSEKLYPQPAYFTVHLNEAGIDDKIRNDFMGFIKAQKFDYLAVAFWVEDGWVGSEVGGEVTRERLKQFSPGEKIVSDMADDMRRPFTTLWNQKRPGPMVEIYRINWKDGRNYGN